MFKSLEIFIIFEFKIITILVTIIIIIIITIIIIFLGWYNILFSI